MAKEGQLDYLHYYSRRNFQYRWLSNQEVVERLLDFSPDLRAAYEYYQDLITAISHHSQALLDQLIKQNNLPNSMRRVKRTLAKHRQEIIASFYTRLTNGRIADTAGYQPLNQPIHEDGETAYFTQLPVKAIARAIREAGLSSTVSYTAGTYVCNHIFYQVQYMRDKFFPNIKAGFIHIPFLPDQVIHRTNTPAMSLADDVKGLTAAIGAIVDRDGKGDIEAIEGYIA